MPTKKKAGKGRERSNASPPSKREAKATPVEASQASAEESTRATKASSTAKTTSAPKKPRGPRQEKQRAKPNAAAKASTPGARPGADPVSAALSEAQPTREQISARAYELFASNGYQHGHADEHWLQAERELRREYAAKKRPPSKPRPTFSSV